MLMPIPAVNICRNAILHLELETRKAAMSSHGTVMDFGYIYEAPGKKIIKKLDINENRAI